MNLVGKTEDKILSTILKNKPLIQYRFSSPRRRVFAFASLVFAILILAFIAFEDTELLYRNLNLSSALKFDRDRIVNSTDISNSAMFAEITEDSHEFVLNVPEEDSDFKKRRESSTSLAGNDRSNLILASDSEVRSALLSEDLFEPEIITVESITEKEKILVDNSVNPTVIVSNDNEKSSLTNLPEITVNEKPEVLASDNAVTLTEPTETSSKPVLPVMAFSPNNNNTQVMSASLAANFPNLNQNFYEKVSDIRISSFLGTEVLQAGFNTKDAQLVSNFSQGISYNIDEVQRVGIDFGYSRYSYDDTKIGRMRVGISNHDGNGNSGFVGSSVLVKDYDGSTWIEFPYVINVQQQLMWGAGFYERTLFNSENLKIDGRVGLGGTNEGPLGYTRVFANYRIFNWLSINAGADARAFIWKNPVFSSSGTDVKSAISIIYGFEIKL
jgi:hypothetical protein